MKRSDKLTRLIPILFFLMGPIMSCGDESNPSTGLDGGRLFQEADHAILPNWATAEELRIKPWFDAPDPTQTNPALPPLGFRIPAEYEPTRAVVMTWAGYTTMLSQISVQVAQAGAEVWMVGGPTSISGIPADKYRSLDIGYDSVWMRDYGPIGINESTGKLGIVDTTYRHYYSRWQDDAMPCNIARLENAGCYPTVLILDGGNFMTDGQGNVFMTTRTYEWNSSLSRNQVDQQLVEYFGAQTIHALEYAKDGSGMPADGTGHIDMFAKLLGHCKVLVAQANESPYREVLEQAASYFSLLECEPGQTYQVYRIRGWSDGWTWYTYTNALIVGQTVIVPSYGGVNNEEARLIYQQALPGYQIALVNSDSSIQAGGSIHCVTKEIPKTAVAAGESSYPFGASGLQ